MKIPWPRWRGRGRKPPRGPGCGRAIRYSRGIRASLNARANGCGAPCPSGSAALAALMPSSSPARGRIPSGAVAPSRTAGELVRRQSAALLSATGARPQASPAQGLSNAIERLQPLLPDLLALGRSDRLESDVGPQHVPCAGVAGATTIHYGVREFGMWRVDERLALHGRLHNLLRGHLAHVLVLQRMLYAWAALMRQRVITVHCTTCNHAREDGVRRTPLEQASSLRLIPKLASVWRRADRRDPGGGGQASIEHSMALTWPAAVAPEPPHFDAVHSSSQLHPAGGLPPGRQRLSAASNSGSRPFRKSPSP